MRVASHAEYLDEEANGREHAHSPVTLQFLLVFAGLLLTLNSWLVGWIFGSVDATAASSAALGAAILGFPIVWTAVKDLRGGALNTNVLVAMAVLALFGSAHYREAAIVSFFMLLGQLIETRTAQGALASLQSLIRLAPTKARRLTGTVEQEVAVHTLRPGDSIRARPGDHVAADGVVLSGQSSVNEASITGESLPVDKQPGDEVFAGTLNLTGVLEIRVTRAGRDTTLGRVRELILAAEKTRPRIVRIVDEYMGYYTPLVVMIGALVSQQSPDREGPGPTGGGGGGSTAGAHGLFRDRGPRRSGSIERRPGSRRPLAVAPRPWHCRGL